MGTSYGATLGQKEELVGPQSCSSHGNSKINTDLMNDAIYNFTSENSFISCKFRPVQWNLTIKDTLNEDSSLMRTLSAVPTT